MYNNAELKLKIILLEFLLKCYHLLIPYYRYQKPDDIENHQTETLLKLN